MAFRIRHALWATLISFVTMNPTLFAGDRIQAMIDLINSTRYQFGLSQVSTHPILREAAFNHARDMAVRGYLAHVTPEGWDLGIRLHGVYQRHQYPHIPYLYGEVVASFDGPESTLAAWLQSNGHRRVLLDSRYTLMGVAHYYSAEYGHRWTVIMATANSVSKGQLH